MRFGVRPDLTLTSLLVVDAVKLMLLRMFGFDLNVSGSQGLFAAASLVIEITSTDSHSGRAF